MKFKIHNCVKVEMVRDQSGKYKKIINETKQQQIE